MSADPVPLKVAADTHRRIRLAAAIEGCTMGEFLDRAVDDFLRAHRDEVEGGFAYARETLCLPERAT